MNRIARDVLSFYSKPSVRKTGLFELYLKGNPVYIGSNADSEVWIQDVTKKVDSHIGDPYHIVSEILKKTTGMFLILLRTADWIIIASDPIRSFPVFYGYKEGRFFITDKLEDYQNEVGRLKLDFPRMEEFMATGNVFGEGTLYENVSAIQAAEIVSIKGKDIRSSRYFEYKPGMEYNIFEKTEDFAKEFDDQFLFVFSRMVKQNPDVNNWVVPLSGGHDSRLVVNYLYRLGVKNVVCFSYGSPGNIQAQISKQVADALGYDWYFVEYTNQKWKELFDNGLFYEYVDFAFNGVSTVHIQDFLALSELKTGGIIKEGDIIIPGHTAVAESLYSKETRVLTDKEEALRLVSSKFVVMSDTSKDAKTVLSAIGRVYEDLNSNPGDFLATWYWQERQAKFITNSMRAYEFFGFRCLQPMWDMEIVNFWLKIPPREGDEREPLYLAEGLEILVENLKSIPYAFTQKNTATHSLVRLAKKIVPNKLIIIFLRLTRRQLILNEGLNQVYALAAGSVKELLAPLDDFPKESIPYFREYLNRYPHQMDYNKLTTLYTLRLLLYKSK